MKDEHDNTTIDLLRGSGAALSPPARTGRAAQPFAYFGKRAKHRRVDAKSAKTEIPACAALHPVPELPAFQAHFVPVSFAAHEWKVSTRRVRVLLTSGRLAGRRQDNGYWEVRYPYQFTFGTRGPALKRHREPKNKLGKSELRLV